MPHDSRDVSGPGDLAQPSDGDRPRPALGATLDELVHLRAEFARFMLEYRFGIEEVKTKVEILQLEFLHLHEHNPIEHVSTRLKTPESIIAKVTRKGLDPSFDVMRASITDIAGVRVICSFVSDVYRVTDMLIRQADLTVLAVKDYIAEPKPNGYRSLHVLVQVPVFLSHGTTAVAVELQLRTVAMDFWASLEHKIHYKYDRDVPDQVRKDLDTSARTAAELDALMEDLHRQVHGDDGPGGPAPGDAFTPSDATLETLRRIRGMRH